jgi:hypothetical protein
VNCPEIKAAEGGVHVVGRELRDDEIRAAGLRVGDGENAVFVPWTIFDAAIASRTGGSSGGHDGTEK